MGIDDEKKSEGVVVDFLGKGRLGAESDEAMEAYLRAKREGEERRRRWPADGKEAMSVLAKKFPSLEGAPGVEPWDQDAFLRWLCSKGLSHGELLAARFVLGVWNSSTPWEEIAREDGYPYPEHAKRFDLFEAYGTWDRGNMEAFLSWADAPFWP